MNRNEHLSQSLPTWLRCRNVDEVIILDWSSSENVSEVIEKYQDGRILLARVNKKKLFHQAKTKNLKIKLCSNENILSLDVDIKILSSDFLIYNEIKKGFFRHGWFEDQMHTTGTCLINKNDFLLVNGYNEFLVGYGWEDRDFYNRLSKKGVHGKRIDNNRENLYHIPHDNESRAKCTPRWFSKLSKNCHVSNERLSKIIIWNKYFPMRKHKVHMFYPDGSIKTIKI